MLIGICQSQSKEVGGGGRRGVEGRGLTEKGEGGGGGGKGEYPINMSL